MASHADCAEISNRRNYPMGYLISTRFDRQLGYFLAYRFSSSLCRTRGIAFCARLPSTIHLGGQKFRWKKRPGLGKNWLTRKERIPMSRFLVKLDARIVLLSRLLPASIIFPRRIVRLGKLVALITRLLLIFFVCKSCCQYPMCLNYISLYESYSSVGYNMSWKNCRIIL